MKKSSLVAAAAAVAALAAGIAWINGSGQTAEAQQPVARAAQGMPATALVDINYIFKKHARFRAAMQQFDEEVKAAQVEWKRQNDALTKEAEQFQGYNYKPGSPEYTQGEEAILKKRMELQTRITMQKREFIQREAKLYYNVYQEILNEVQYYCSANNISLVLNFQGDKINPDNPQDIVRGVNQPVVFYNKDLDITPWILSRISPPNPPGDRMSTPRPGVPYK